MDALLVGIIVFAIVFATLLGLVSFAAIGLGVDSRPGFGGADADR
jgi:hypothetical protein